MPLGHDQPPPGAKCGRQPYGLDHGPLRTYVLVMRHASGLPEERLALLYNGEGFGGEQTMRARVIRELIDEIRVLRSELLQAETGQDGPQTGR